MSEAGKRAVSIFRTALLRAMAQSGLSVNEVAHRLGWPPARVWGYLDNPAGTRAETYGALFYAISGKLPELRDARK